MIPAFPRVKIAQESLLCDSCRNYFHKPWISNKYKTHVPDLVDDDLFMCHIYYKEKSDEEAAREGK